MFFQLTSLGYCLILSLLPYSNPRLSIHMVVEIWCLVLIYNTQFGNDSWSDEWTLESVTMQDWFVKIRSLNDADCSIRCRGSVISWWSP